jgi:tetratricopeptide (TPR) repeat protein
MLKFAFILLLWRLLAGIFGNPWLAVVVILILYYIVDRRYIGLLPSLARPLRRWRRAAELRRRIDLSPHDADARYELAQLYLAQRRYHAAETLLTALPLTMREMPDVQYDEGVCALGLGDGKRGEALILSALAEVPNLRYGEPYLKLAALHLTDNPALALEYVREAQRHNQSSCEAFYRLAMLYRRLQDAVAAREALRQCLTTYRSLPRFRRRAERRWALLAWLRLRLASGR